MFFTELNYLYYFWSYTVMKCYSRDETYCNKIVCSTNFIPKFWQSGNREKETMTGHPEICLGLRWKWSCENANWLKQGKEIPNSKKCDALDGKHEGEFVTFFGSQRLKLFFLTWHQKHSTKVTLFWSQPKAKWLFALQSLAKRLYKTVCPSVRRKKGP